MSLAHGRAHERPRGDCGRESETALAAAARRRAAPDARQAVSAPRPGRCRGVPIIPGRYGQIEWYCDGENCGARFGGFCSLPRQFALAVYTNRPRLFGKLSAIPGMKRHQTGDSEMRAVFPPAALEQVAIVLKARRRRTLKP